MFCPNCGTKNDKDAVFCENCGTRLDTVPTPTNSAPTNQRPVSPDPIPSTRVSQIGRKPASTKRNQIIIGIVIAVVVIAAGAGYYFYRQNQNSSLVTSSASSKKKTSRATSSSKAVSKPATEASSKTPTKAALWSTDKTDNLSAFMSTWQDTMNQSYEGTYDGQSVDDDDVILPDDIENGDYKDKITVDDNQVTLKWTPKANTDAEYQVVAAAVYDHEKDGEEEIIAYLYVFHNGDPDVLVSQDVDSNVHNFTSSRNQDLQNGFAKVANAATNN